MATEDDAMITSQTTDDDSTTDDGPIAAAAADNTTAMQPTTTNNTRPHISWCDSYSKAQSAIDSLKSIIPHIPASLLSSETPAFALLHDPEIAIQCSHLLRQPDSGGGDNNLCRWFYDTFQTSVPDLQLVVLRFLPVLAGVYLSRASLHKPLAGFEAVLLALYAHETTARDGQAVTVCIPDISHSSIYHESTQTLKNSATELNMAVITPSLEPHGRVRSTRRARIVGVALELYYSKISEMPVDSKIEFCEFFGTWAGEFGNNYDQPGIDNLRDGQNKNGNSRGGRINLSWELLQPILRILGHCLMGPEQVENKELREAASNACRALYLRSLHDINSRSILATGSLVKMSEELTDSFDHTEIAQTNVISL
ncbi:OLC1v1026153C1 [Oldenlandia corymbosa var. corymbosa]|uniref:OLC1v1026153C1 n=1 Tax=Oldenlandia corymbosa var. corymbosa TaxID=529605 RepID=A0AAV1C866_OLDCO|nr:OLC1v1026153C1 [Oldenlandia corymbosa var. corymbosa]